MENKNRREQRKQKLSKVLPETRRGGRKRGRDALKCLGVLKCQTQFQDFFLQEDGTSVPQGPGTGRTHCGPSWAATPEGRLALLLRSACRPRKGNSGLGLGRPRTLDADDRGREQRCAPEASPLQVATPPRLPPWRGPHAQSLRSPGLRSRPTVRRPSPRAGWARVSRLRWWRGGWESCAS